MKMQGVGSNSGTSAGGFATRNGVSTTASEKIFGVRFVSEEILRR